MKLRKLNALGMRHFEDFIRLYRLGQEGSSLSDLIASASLGLDITNLDFDPNEITLESRLEFAQSIDRVLKRSSLDKTDEAAPELWAWLTLVLFDRLKVYKGKRPGEHAIWYPDKAWGRFYRHVLYGPWRIYRLHSARLDLLQPLLHGVITTHGEFYEQIASSEQLVQSQGVLGAARELYWDEQSNRLKPGHAIRGEIGEATGSVRRFSQIVHQLSLTWDMNGISSQELLNLLPDEFTKWKV